MLGGEEITHELTWAGPLIPEVAFRSSTLPRATTRATDTEGRNDKVTAATSSTSLYDNVGATQTGSTQGTKGAQREGSQTRQMRDRAVQQQSDTSTMTTNNTATGPKTVTASVGTENNVGSQISQTESQSQTQTTESQKSEGTQAGGSLPPNTKTSSTSTRPPLRDNLHHVLTNTKSVDYSEIDMVRDAELRAAHHHNILNNNISARRSKSKSTEDMNRENGISLDSNTLKRMLKPMPSADSPVTSPEMGRRRYNYYNTHHHQRLPNNNNNGRLSEPESGHPHPRSAMAQSSRFSASRSSHEIGRAYPGRGLYLELERGAAGDFSPPSDNVIFDNQCYATTPSSSNGNSDHEGSHHYRHRHMHPHPQVNYKAFGVDCLSDRQIFRWHKAFAEGREDVNDENRAGRPSTSSSDDNVKRVRDLLNTDRRLSVRLISETLDITKIIVHEIVSESLGMRKVCAKLVPEVLTDDQKARRNSTTTPTPGSPTSRLLLEYEMHLRNTLAKGMDAESYSLHTFEALLTQSMENLEFAESLPGSTQRSPYPARKRPSSSASMNKSSTLPLSHRLSASSRDRTDRDRERDGYYSDRNELMREREKDRERDRGYLSDHNSSFTSRCASCIGESSRAQWFRHSDGWRSGSSTFGSGQGLPQGHKRSPWDSLPSLRQDSSMNDSGYKSTRTDSFEQRQVKYPVVLSQYILTADQARGMFDRQDSLRSDYMSDREPSRYGIVQQASIESADSRLCYLTSSEVSFFPPAIINVYVLLILVRKHLISL
ncbi:hypothetical protein NQ318_009917 [Aromia moschata]|uniref:Uncharacterized protein n=1 Tax=Aromia moschata TaxID=1265417 RepID=A0AAV8YC86_9CUCU|nr:hypothetical protein NQ318_009917 [Aromia moschata]